MAEKYTAVSLADIAEQFNLTAHGLDNPVKLGHVGLKRDRDQRRIQAQVWREAARILMATELVSP